MLHLRKVEETTLVVFETLRISREVWPTKEGEVDRVDDGKESKGEVEKDRRENGDGNGDKSEDGDGEEEEVGGEINKRGGEGSTTIERRKEQNSEEDKGLVAEGDEVWKSLKGK